MKKILIVLMSLLVLPFNVKAAAYSDVFHVGDRVIALLENDTKRMPFYVIKESSATDNYVWLMYAGTLGMAMYDDVDPNENSATGVFEDATIYGELTRLTESWRNRVYANNDGVIRLPQLDDFTALGINKNNSASKYQIMQNREFLVLNWSAGLQQTEAGTAGYNYWTSSCVNDVCTGDAVSMYVVTNNEDYNGDSLTPVATLEEVNISEAITSTDPNAATKFSIRPVVKVDKKWIDCNLTTTPDNPETAEVVLPIEFMVIAALAALGYVIVRKREVFTKI